jgi:hypothetical protein
MRESSQRCANRNFSVQVSQAIVSHFSVSFSVSCTALLTSWLLLLTLPAYSQNNSSEMTAQQVLRAGVDGELKAEAADHSHWMYQVKSQEDGKEKIKIVIESKDGEIDRLESVDGVPITVEQAKQEEQRIDSLVHSPERQKKRQRAQAEDGDQTDRMFRMLPDALSVRFGQRKGDLVELLFEPNPDYHAWSREAIVFHEMEGRVWIDTRQNRLAEIEGRLTKTVKFAGGLLGYLDKGGEFHVQQTEVAPGHWEMTLLHVNMHGKILFLRTISEQQHEVRSEYRQVPSDLGLADAAQELQRENAIRSAHRDDSSNAKRGDIAVTAR